MNEKEQPIHLDLFSGIGGFALAAQWAGFRTIGFCEIEDYPCRVLGKHWPDVPIHRDIRKLDGADYAGIDLITGGYPCQPFSVAGKQRGAADDRHLWPEMFRIIKQARPAWVVAENVAGHIRLGLDEVLSDLEGEGYTARAIVVPAVAVDAPHRRDRVWVVAHTLSERRRHAGSAEGGREACTGTRDEPARADGRPADVAHSQRQRGCSGDSKWEDAAHVGKPPGHPRHDIGGACQWLPEPDVGRVAHGIPARVHRLKGLGNAIVPQVAYQILNAIRTQ